MQSFQAALEPSVEGFQWEPTLAVVNGRYGPQQDGIEPGGPCQVLERPGLDAVVAVEGFVLGLGSVALLAHQWFFTWPPAPSLTPTRLVADQGRYRCKRFIAIVIDGCRADRLLEADTPFMDRMRREGVDYVNTSTVYPARTVTGFSSMFTGAPPRTHGMRSNFVPSLGVKCESIFDSLRDSGLSGRLVGIAHLVDAFGDDVETVTAVTHNDEIDDALVARAKAVMERGNPDLLALQLLSVDQTGHARGSYNAEYLAKIEAADRKDRGVPHRSPGFLPVNPA